MSIGGTRSFWLGGICAFLLLAGEGCGGCDKSSPTEPTEPEPGIYDIGSNNPDVIVAFGDSISDGYDSVGGEGYRDDLEELFAADGRSITVLDEGEPGTFSADGADRITKVLAHDRPAVLILLYGTNDEFTSLPKHALEIEEDTTSANLIRIITAARANKTLVVVSTIPPVCLDSREFQRNNISEMNDKIREFVAELQESDNGIFLADAWNAFLDDAPPDGCDLINMDRGNHPNEAGYATLARTYYDSLFYVAW